MSAASSQKITNAEAVAATPPHPGATLSSKLAANPLGGIVSELDADWSHLLYEARNTAKNFGFEPVELGPIEDSNLLNKLTNHPSLSTSANPGPEEKLTGIRTSLLPTMLRLFHASHSARNKKTSKWSALGPVLQTSAKNTPAIDWQLALGVFGDTSIVAESQGLCAVWQLCRQMGLEQYLQLEINSIGSLATQKNYGALLSQYLKPKKYNLCDSCVENLSSQPMDVLRCQQLDCQTLLVDGPVILDSLDEESQSNFTHYLEALEELGVPYQLNPQYAGTAGASGICVSAKLKLENQFCTIMEGFRVDSLAQALFNKPYSGFFLSCSLSSMRTAAKCAQSQNTHEVYLVPLGDLATRKSLHIFYQLVSSGVSVFDSFGTSGVKNQLKVALDNKGKIALIMGQREAVEEKVMLRDLISGMQEIFHHDQVVEEVKKRLGR